MEDGGWRMEDGQAHGWAPTVKDGPRGYCRFRI
jgi:hypothetical protein